VSRLSLKCAWTHYALFVVALIGCRPEYIKIHDTTTQANNPDKVEDYTETKDTTNYIPPVTPNAMLNVLPGHTPSFQKNLTIRVGGVNAGDTIKIYTDSTCTLEIGSAVATSATIDITTTTLMPGIYTIYSRAIGIHNNPSACSSVSLTYEALFCPEGFITVPGNATFSTDNFCVMKYEAKALKNDTDELQLNGGTGTGSWASIYHPETYTTGYRPASVRDAKPWRWISQSDAKTACANLGAGYALINNPEWMTIAHNIENVAANWSNAAVGDGHLSRGHSDNSPDEPCDALLENVHTNCSTLGATWNQRRTNTLSNGEVIWDFSGNVFNIIDWNIDTTKKAYIHADGAPLAAWRDWTALHADPRNTSESDPMPTWTWSASNPNLTSAENIGRYHAGAVFVGGAARRGGAWLNGTDAGIFSLVLNATSGSTINDMGFRCSYHP
jgi:hypothetical protein